MAAFFRSSLVKFLILAIITKGLGEELKCDKDSITVNTTLTGNMVNGKTEYKVDIFNACHCKNANIRLDCKGFNTVEKVDPASMVVIGDECVICGDGSFIPPFTATFFNYAWDVAFPFTPLSCDPDCS